MSLKVIKTCPNCGYKSLYIREDGSMKCYKCGYEVDVNGNVVNKGYKSIKKVSKTKEKYMNQLCPKCGFHKLYIGVQNVSCYNCGFEVTREYFDKHRFDLLNKTTLISYLSDVLTREELEKKMQYLQWIGYIKIKDRYHNKYGYAYLVENKKYLMEISYSHGNIEFVEKRKEKR